MNAPRPQITPEERALIEAHIARHGITVCPPGRMATAVEYEFRYIGNNGDLRPKAGQKPGDALRNGNGAFFRNRARAARLRKAEASQ
ncbi:hypothetical protein [Roseovarius mucosus]|uniref:hypothetical protein n=1 Tax=Roseovarius mucosus TaxID=215743 RepID=UPI0035D0C826